jgi:hypothetical protein
MAKTTANYKNFNDEKKSSTQNRIGIRKNITLKNDAFLPNFDLGKKSKTKSQTLIQSQKI